MPKDVVGNQVQIPVYVFKVPPCSCVGLDTVDVERVTIFNLVANNGSVWRVNKVCIRDHVGVPMPPRLENLATVNKNAVRRLLPVATGNSIDEPTTVILVVVVVIYTVKEDGV